MEHNTEFTQKEISRIKHWLINHDSFDRTRYYRYSYAYFKTNNIYELYYHILFNLEGIQYMFPFNEYHPKLRGCYSVENILDVWFNIVLGDVFEELMIDEI
jgi:hypothetical protein